MPEGSVTLRPRRGAPITVLTGTYGAAVLRPLVDASVEVRVVANTYFGGNIGVAGLLAGQDVADAISADAPGRRYLLPDVCLSNGKFLDGVALADLPSSIEVVATNGAALRKAVAA